VNRPLSKIHATSNVITADASDLIASRRFFEAVFAPREPEPIRNYRRLIARGEHDQAEAYLNACNKINRAFDWPEYERPAV
jgi:uncharacterized protein with PhoU and TrkA domain